jgi:ADP-ribosylglycohydrolase
MPEERRRRVRGCLLGGAVGDALGLPIEFDSLREIRSRFGPDGLSGYAPAHGRMGAISDDTQMTLFTAEGLALAARAGSLSNSSELVRHVHRAYLRWLRTQGGGSRHPTFERTREGWLLDLADLHSRRAPGSTCLSALESDRMGRLEQPINHSKGCGGVMRVAPVGLVSGLGDAFRIGCAVAAITHGHPNATLASGFLALAVRELVCGATLLEAFEQALEELRRWPAHEGCSAAVEAAMARSRQRPPTPEAIEALGEGWVAEEALAIAIYSALAAEDLESALLLSVNHGGDSDSTGAITGNLLGVALGEGAIPMRWLEPLELRDEIGRLADELSEF